MPQYRNTNWWVNNWSSKTLSGKQNSEKVVGIPLVKWYWYGVMNCGEVPDFESCTRLTCTTESKRRKLMGSLSKKDKGAQAEKKRDEAGMSHNSFLAIKETMDCSNPSDQLSPSNILIQSQSPSQAQFVSTIPPESEFSHLKLAPFPFTTRVQCPVWSMAAYHPVLCVWNHFRSIHHHQSLSLFEWISYTTRKNQKSKAQLFMPLHCVQHKQIYGNFQLFRRLIHLKLYFSILLLTQSDFMK